MEEEEEEEAGTARFIGMVKMEISQVVGEII